MASITSAPRTGVSYCPVHHGPVSECPPLELADALDALRDLHIDPRLVTEHAFLLDDCGACPDDPDTPPQTAVVRISFTGNTSGRRGHEDACPLHIRHVVRWWRTYGHTVTADVPVPAGVSGRARRPAAARRWHREVQGAVGPCGLRG